MFQKLIDPLVYFRQRKLLTRTTGQKPDNHRSDRFKECCFKACLFIYQATAQRKCLFEKQSLLDVDILRLLLVGKVLLCDALAENVVDTPGNRLRLIKVSSSHELIVVITVE